MKSNWKSRSGDQIRWAFRIFFGELFDRASRPRFAFWSNMPRPAYCEMCDIWTWCTKERACLSSHVGFLCEECADWNDESKEIDEQPLLGGY